MAAGDHWVMGESKGLDMSRLTPIQLQTWMARNGIQTTPSGGLVGVSDNGDGTFNALGAAALIVGPMSSKYTVPREAMPSTGAHEAGHSLDPMNAFGPLVPPDQTRNPHIGERQIMDNSTNPFIQGWKDGWKNMKPQPRPSDPNNVFGAIPLASNDYGYSTDNFYNPNDDQYYNDYSDMYKDNPMRDDFYVQDPFSDIWGNQGGPLQFNT